ncbi:MAG: DUF3352 domain-containing protein, partial [Actinobacteria bacterium]|nr:DUF3352 domain-containing protein [Actinomycetota bacterium]
MGAICASVLAIAGCGGDGGEEAASPLDNALGYLGEDAVFAVSIDTDIKGDQHEAIGQIVRKFPFRNAVTEGVKEAVEEEGGDFKDIEPLLGNEFVVGTTQVGSLVGTTSDPDDFVGAIQAKSGDKLEEAVKREKAQEDGEKNGAKIYKDDDGDSFAVEEDVLIVASSRKLLEDALAQREADDRLTEETFDDGTENLPKDALVRVYGDLQRILAADPSTADARKVEWVKALRKFGATMSFEGDEANIDFRLNTDGGQLTDEDLPFAAGADSPSVVDRAGSIAAALKDPTQIADFAERAAQAIDPSGFGDYETGKRAIEKQLGIDIENDLLKQLEGDLGVTFAVDGKYGVRAELKDPDEFDRTLAKLGRVLPRVAERIAGEPVRYSKPTRGDDFYELSAGGDSIVYGVLDGAFILANDPRTASQLSRESAKAIPGAKGSLVVSSDAEQLA